MKVTASELYIYCSDNPRVPPSTLQASCKSSWFDYFPLQTKMLWNIHPFLLSQETLVSKKSIKQYRISHHSKSFDWEKNLFITCSL